MLQMPTSAADAAAPTTKLSPGIPQRAAIPGVLDSDAEALKQAQLSIDLANAAKEGNRLEREIAEETARQKELLKKLHTPTPMEKLEQVNTFITEQRQTLQALKTANASLVCKIEEEQKLIADIEAENMRKTALTAELAAKTRIQHDTQTKFNKLRDEADTLAQELEAQQKATAAGRAKLLASQEKLNGVSSTAIGSLLNPTSGMAPYAQYTSAPRPGSEAATPPAAAGSNGAERVAAPTASAQSTGNSTQPAIASLSSSTWQPISSSPSAPTSGGVSGDAATTLKRRTSSSEQLLAPPSVAPPTIGVAVKGQQEPPEKRAKGFGPGPNRT